MIDLEVLNAPQREAVAHFAGPLLVLAGAGSGKTRVLTHRVAHLIEARGVPPEEILAVTFTNKAAGEMRERLAGLLGERGRGLTVGTFHAVCARWLRREAPALGLPSSFAIYDDSDQLALCRRALAEAGVSEERVLPQALRGFIDRRKNAGEDGDAPVASPDRELAAALQRAAAGYEVLLRRAGAIDFGGLILAMVRRLATDAARRDDYRARYRHVLVDEYQDVNHAQYLLIQQLVPRSGNLAVVGDDDQSIYGFRGATVRAILDFERDHPDARVVRLEQNYRSTGNILAAAGAVIRRNAGRHGKTLWTDRGAGEKVVVATLADDRAEARFVSAEIASALAAGRAATDVAVFYRTNAQSRLLEEELVRRGIAYRLVGGTRFYDRKEVKDVLAYLRLLANPADDVSLTRVINVPTRGIGTTSVAALAAAARRRGSSIAAVLDDLVADENIAGVASASRSRVREFWAMVGRLRDVLGRASLAEIVERVILETGLAARLRAEGTVEAEVRAENLDELVGAARELDELDAPREGLAAVEAFLERAALISDLDDGDGRRPAVTLMTLHNSKGLEFPIVLLTGMEERVFPHARALEADDVEEERRLCYVGMTRARERLLLTRARHRVLHGVELKNTPWLVLRVCHYNHTRPVGTPGERGPIDSPGAVRGDAMLVRPWSAGGPLRADGAAPREPTVDYSMSQEPCGGGAMRVGTRVRHPEFGAGVVRWREGSGDSTKLTVQFERAGTRKLIVRYAPLEVIAP